MVGGFEAGHFLEVGEEGEGDLVADGGDLDFGEDEAEVLDGAGAAGAAVADESGGFVVPFGVEEVDGVFEGGVCGVVVFGGDEDEAVEGADFGSPIFGVLFGVLAHGGWDGFVEEGEVDVGEIDEFEFGVGAFLGVLEDPVSDVFSDAPGAGAADDDSDFYHDVSFVFCDEIVD